MLLSLEENPALTLVFSALSRFSSLTATPPLRVRKRVCFISLWLFLIISYEQISQANLASGNTHTGGLANFLKIGGDSLELPD
jgi:hypothetical protein